MDFETTQNEQNVGTSAEIDLWAEVPSISASSDVFKTVDSDLIGETSIDERIRHFETDKSSAELDAKLLFFSQSEKRALLSKTEEQSLFREYDIHLKSWIAQLLMIPEAYTAIQSIFFKQRDCGSNANHEAQLTYKQTNRPIDLIRWSYPCIRHLNSVTNRLQKSVNLSSSIKSDLLTQQTAVKSTTDRIVNANTGLVIKIATQYNFLKLPLMDLVQEGFFGLLTAIEKFDLSQGNRFSTYAWWWIKQSIVTYSRKQGGIVRRPESLVDMIIKLQPAIRSTIEPPNTQQIKAISEKLEVDETRVSEAILLQHTDLSINYLAQESSNQNHWEDKHLQSPDSEVLATSKQIDHLLSMLNTREKQILTLRFGLKGSNPCTRREIGEIFGISAERIRQLEDAALVKLKDSLSA